MATGGRVVSLFHPSSSQADVEWASSCRNTWAQGTAEGRVAQQGLLQLQRTLGGGEPWHGDHQMGPTQTADPAERSSLIKATFQWIPSIHEEQSQTGVCVWDKTAWILSEAIMHLSYETSRCRCPSFLEKNKPTSSQGLSQVWLILSPIPSGSQPILLCTLVKRCCRKEVKADCSGEEDDGCRCTWGLTERHKHQPQKDPHWAFPFHFLILFCGNWGQTPLFIIL